MCSNKTDREMISVVVPVYNVAAYLERCVKSIQTQTYGNIEILLIDDGSKDLSGHICDKFASSDERITVYHKNNGGLGSARNFGINKANGEYICFIDSDDTIEPDYLECLYRAIIRGKADLSVCGYFYSANNISASYAFSNRVIDASEMIKMFACGNPFFNFAWNKLYRKDVIERMPMHFSDRHCAEDMYFNAIYYRYTNKIATVEKPLYTYYVNLESLSNSRRKGFWEDMLLIYDTLEETCRLKCVPIEYANNLLLVMFRNSVSNYFNHKTTLKECKGYIDECIESKDLRIIRVLYSSISKADQLIYKALVKHHYFMIYIYMKVIKWIKVKHFKIFYKIRRTVSRRS